MAWCRVAAAFAVSNPIGRLRGTELERVLDAIAAGALGVTPAVPRLGGARRRVLHVLSEAAEIGGLSRLAWRWIAWDEDSVSSVVVTRQSNVIRPLVELAEASGGSAAAIEGATLVERAQVLRTRAEHADVVICHAQPDDPIIAVAFGAGYGGAPVAFFNHPDHQFWLAPSRLRAVVDFRDVGAVLTCEARGYVPSMMARMPLPIDTRPRSFELRVATRSALGVGSDQILAVTVARPVKFKDTRIRPCYADLVRSALRAVPRLVVCAVGPIVSDEPWPSLLAEFGDRVRVPGSTPTPDAYLDAADLYLDTFPFSSLTSMLEAAAKALPIVTLDAHLGLVRALGVGDFVAAAEDRPCTPDQLVTRIATLANDEGVRLAAGKRSAAQLLLGNTRDAWRAHREGLYDTLEREPPSESPRSALREDEELAAYASVLAAIEEPVPLLWSINTTLSEFDELDRRSLRLRRLGSRVALKLGARRSSDRLLLPRCGVPMKPSEDQEVK